MLKKLTAALFAFLLSTGLAFAQADVNKADQAALDGIKGIGPAMSKRILDERKKGEFKDWSDFETRVKGVGEKSAVKLSDAGLTVNGQARGKSAVAPAKSAGKPFGKKKDGKEEAAMDKPGATKG
ncbi:ComEA family DNA-binding protein [Herbaspirillum lusitanum]|uniref:ComEA family DNA-binding protein n=1 Tax=Herbaspirillum lusitanum TaxID=213312 RepID=UPI0002E137E3|nr:helix-hairpin-helix domain-containing protein [Herbaspirillum lusitanum]MCW5298008.1 helix-hairpin-helix domain-containing protein [Herbaspirillum lusitanum]